MSKRKHRSKHGREPRYQRQTRRFDEAVPGYRITTGPNGGTIWIPINDSPSEPKQPKQKRKFKWSTVSEEEVERIAVEIFGGTTYFCYQDRDEEET